MAPLITTNTVRVKTKFRAFTAEHTLNTRYSRGTSGAAAQAENAALWTDFFGAFRVESVASDFAFISVDYSPEDDPIFYPAGTLPTAPAGTLDPATVSRNVWATHTKLAGRGGGRNCSFEAFGIQWPLMDPTDAAADGLVYGIEDAYLEAALVVLNSASLVSVANVAVTWKQRANIKVNDYWRDEFKQ